MRSISHPYAQVLVYPDAQTFQRAATDEFLRSAREAILERGSFKVALAGGSTPRATYASLAESEQKGTAQVAWDKVEVFFGDERTVPPEHTDSNFRMAQEVLLSKVPFKPERIHRLQGEMEPNQAAKEYEAEIRKAFQIPAGTIPKFDLILLGMGGDGHTASLFPGSAALEETTQLVCSNWVEKFGTHRLTFTFPVLNAAGADLFMVMGADKARMVGNILRPPSTDPVYPAQRVRPAHGRLLWMLDEAAAGELGR